MLQARRKLLREEIEKARDAVAELQDVAIRFHMHAYSVSDRMQIMSHLTDIERRCSLFPKIATSRRFLVPNAVKPAGVTVALEQLVRLRQAITLHHFDDPEMTPLLHSDPLLSNITSAATQMVAEIDRTFVAALD